MSNQLPPFDPNKADADGVRVWLQAALDGYFRQDMGRWAFRPLEHYVDVRDDLAEDLRAIYQDVDAHAQVRWRFAVRDLLAMQGCDPAGGDATRLLIDFAALVRASEVLDVLPKLVANGSDSLLDQVVETAVALACQTDAARTCLERIYTSPSFSPDYAGLVLVALCHADPDGWLCHVENLGQPMGTLAGRLAAESNALRSYAHGILEAISLSRVSSACLKRLATKTESTWLWNEWVADPHSLLLYELDAESGPRLSFRDNDAASVTLEEPLVQHLPVPPTRRMRGGKKDVTAAANRTMMAIAELVAQGRQQGQDRQDATLAYDAVGVARDLVDGNINCESFRLKLIELARRGIKYSP